MRREFTITHEFVEFIPNDLQEGVVYVSIAFATAAHKCFCGCGNEVVTPLSPTDWTLLFDGQTVSLDPSIGNWSFPCQSHYWIKRDRVRWAGSWSQEQIHAGRLADSVAKDRYFDHNGGQANPATDSDRKGKNEQRPTLWQRMKKWLFK